MDPNAAWSALAQAMADDDGEQVATVADGLLMWLNRGGFPPTIAGESAFDAIVAKATCGASPVGTSDRTALLERRGPLSKGNAASLTWYRMLTDGRGTAERAQACSNLTAYCKLDTLAMVKVFQQLKNVAAR